MGEGWVEGMSGFLIGHKCLYIKCEIKIRMFVTCCILVR